MQEIRETITRATLAALAAQAFDAEPTERDDVRAVLADALEGAGRAQDASDVRAGSWGVLQDLRDRNVKRTIVRERDGEWCALEVEIVKGRLSICGSAGYVLSPRAAKREALERAEEWLSERENLAYVNERNGVNFRSPARAARYVIDADGDYAGLDVYAERGEGRKARVLVTTSCGQIREEIARWFPEAAPYFEWHLNDLRAECPHQRTRGETYETHPCAVCPDCGWKLGAGWYRDELPEAVYVWAESLVSS